MPYLENLTKNWYDLVSSLLAIYFQFCPTLSCVFVGDNGKTVDAKISLKLLNITIIFQAQKINLHRKKIGV